MLQAWRSWVWVLVRSLKIFNLPNPSCCTIVLGFTQPLTEMSTRTFWGKMRPLQSYEHTFFFMILCEWVIRILFSHLHEVYWGRSLNSLRSWKMELPACNRWADFVRWWPGIYITELLRLLALCGYLICAQFSPGTLTQKDSMNIPFIVDAYSSSVCSYSICNKGRSCGWHFIHMYEGHYATWF
jgi:hypothetical protein